MISRREFIKNALICSAGITAAGIIPGKSFAEEKTSGLKEAWFYEKTVKGAVICSLCPHGCRIAEGKRGLCRVRENRGGKLYTLVYGKPVAIHRDPIEKKPLYHFMPGQKALSIATAGCNLRCSFCQNWEISQANPDAVPSYKGSPDDIRKQAVKGRSPIIAYTYTEPSIFYEYMYNTAAAAGNEGIKNVMISAGYINEAPIKKLLPVLDAVKIDLKAFNDKFYREVVGGSLTPVLETLYRIKQSGTWLEIVNLIIPGKNDSHDEIKNLARWIGTNLGWETPIHFTRFIPLYKLKNLPPTPVKTLERCRNTAIAEGLKFVYVGNVPGHKGNNTYCPRCGKILLERKGFRTGEKNLTKGKCNKCGQKIPGVWS